MHQVLLDPRSGTINVVDVPHPHVHEQGVLVRTVASLISVGTERSVTRTARKSLVGKARERPEQVRQVVAKLRTDGITSTMEAVFAKLSTPIPLGYSSAGVVVEVGRKVLDIRPGDSVACAGGGFASHAEVAYVPRTLIAPIPEGVSFEQAAFATVGAVGLQGIRVASPTLGEAFVVVGLGLIGQLTVQLLRAHGCRVFGVDVAADRVALARSLGAEDGCGPAEAAERISFWTRGRGADGVLITASTKSSGPVRLAGEVSRQKGRVVVVGAVGMNIPRDQYYRKELAFTVSMSYGPGRYDTSYEESGNDYPLGYVRWTEGRNLEAFLDMAARGAVDVDPLITTRHPIARAAEAYELINSPAGRGTLGALLTYPAEVALTPRVSVPGKRAAAMAGATRVAVIGAGNYAQIMLLPHLKRIDGLDLHTIATSGGISARRAAEKFGFANATSAVDDLISDEEVDAVIIATRHDSHSELAAAALRSGKHVFLEKPLAITEDQLVQLETAAHASDRILMAGFNRRFAPLSIAAREYFRDHAGPLAVNCRVNAGYLPPDHWTQDPDVGGGRIIGEACHFVDLLSFLTDSIPVRVLADSASAAGAHSTGDDICSLVLRFENGSIGSISYFANGDKVFPKERVEIFGGGAVFVVDDFRATSGARSGKSWSRKHKGQDKGHKAALEAFFTAVRDGGMPPIPYDSQFATTRATFAAVNCLRSGTDAGSRL